MITLPLPDGNVQESIRACAASIQNVDLAHRLIAAELHFVAAERNYEGAAQHTSLFSIADSNDVAGMITVEEMKNLYKNTFAKLGSSCRHLYDKIRVRAKICPLCNSRSVTTLDHYLPQANHAAFVLTPLNMVPACGDCNKQKLVFDPSVIEEQTLHPYFDMLPTDQAWLNAEIIPGKPPGVVFSAVPPTHWDATLASRLIHHFDSFGLNELYSAKAASEVAQIAALAEIEYVSCGSVGLRNHLQLQASVRRAAAPHSWIPALYKGLADCEWFIDGGFRDIEVG
ncbi:Protein ea31, putative [Ricinus communis]|uniref:Protein ea31, putative n=1 Tax=Ricinus communis TaxID=3988 RepID=B9TBX4_RICCO|nr:Protein ea31, putative [Ricinus communis]